VIGGVAPVGHPVRLRTVVDTALADYDEVWAAGGVPHAVFPTSFTELVTLTGGTAAAVAEGH
jgi:prolyl-tRNA editing enzyme YbaK/EbsC (Cys-tRNA(Pro) deacylase)